MAAYSQLCKLGRQMILRCSNGFLAHQSKIILVSNRWASTIYSADFQPPPKKPLTAYNLFVKDQLLDRDPDKPVKETMQQIGALWSNLSDNDKERYKQLYADKLKEWNIEYEAFLSTLPDRDEYLRQLTELRIERRRSLKTFREKKQNKHLKPPRKLSAYNVYMRDQLAGANKEDIEEIFIQAAQNWKVISEDKKAEYEDEAKQINQHELEEFNKNKSSLSQQDLKSSV